MSRMVSGAARWWCLWFLVSAILALAIFAVVASLRSVVDYPAGIFSRPQVTEALATFSTAHPRCLDGTTQWRVTPRSNDHWIVRISCNLPRPIAKALGLAVLPGAILAAIGLIMGWVYRGFRAKSAVP